MGDTELVDTVSELLNQTQDLETLEAIQKVVKNRIDVVSSSGSEGDGDKDHKTKKKRKKKKKPELISNENKDPQVLNVINFC